MRNNLAKVFSMLMIATALLGFAGVLPIGATPPPPPANMFFVDPKDNIFPPPPMAVGSTFTINVSIANTTLIAGINFELFWDPTLLNCMSNTEVFFYDPQITPIDNQTNINYIKHATDNGIGKFTYGCTYYDMAEGKTDGYIPINITTAKWPEGKHGLVKLVFKVMKAPTHSEGFVQCAFSFGDVVVGDPVPNTIEMNIVPGTYRLNWAPPTELPFYSVEPPTYTASNPGEEFNINVKVNNLDPNWEAVGFEFKLGYNDTILEILNVTEGPWLPPFGALPNQGTLPMHVHGIGFLQFGDVVMPDENGTWHAPFAGGSGVLAIIKFRATMQGLFPNVFSCPLDLYDTLFADWKTTQINQTAPVDGYYSMKPKVLGRMIDIYTQYPDPYGGQGLNAPSDMFWPQKEVCLYAKVTYNEWPEQQKDVAFEIFDPHNTRWGVIYARTDQNGIAVTCFRLPWPCDNPEYYIGVWKIIGTVDVACVIVNDTLWFHYDYLVRIWKVTADKTSYKHNESIWLTIDYGSHSQQIRNVTIAVTALDETGVPFGFVYKMVQIGGAVFCQYKNFTDRESVFIPKWARAGEAEIDTAFLDKWPFLGGTVHSGYYDSTTGKWLPYCPIKVSIVAE